MNFKAHLHNLKLFLYYLGFLLLILVYIFLIAWTYCYSLFVCYLLIAAFLSSVIIFTVNKSKRQSVKFLLLGAVLFVLLLPINLKQYNNHAETLQLRVNNKEELNTKERLGIYGCLIMVTIFDIVPFPEVGIQNFYLFFPDHDKQRIFHSNSILNSPSILSAVKLNPNGYVAWNKWTTLFSKDFRYSAAFDPCIITTEKRDGCREVTLKTDFHYREDYVTIHAHSFLSGWFMFRIDEGLFWYLQQKGWLHPYTAIWKAKLDD